MRGFINFVTGALVGSLVGAALALLMTPASGEALRLRMQTQAQQIENEVRQAATDRRVELEQQLAALRQPHKASD